MRKTKIANGQGFWGDSIQAPIDLITSADINYLTLDYLAEITLSIMQKQKNKNNLFGYALDFLDLINISGKLLKKNKIKLITNAGGVNPFECSKALKKILVSQNINLNIGYIEGDDIYDKLDILIKQGADLCNMDTGENIEKIRDRICSANVYIDSYEIKKALDNEADIVLAGRVTDPGLTLGPLLHEFDWKKNDYNKLASGTLAGHIIECGAQCTGGNYSKWYNIDDFINIGYPIVEVSENGNFNIIKTDNTGGLINKDTVCEQILYEMGNPKKYISPDVCVDFTSFSLIDNGDNNVSISNVRGYKPTDTYKVSISYFNGYKSSGQLTISGPNAVEKAKLIEKIIWKKLDLSNSLYEEKLGELVGISSCMRDIQPMPREVNEVVLRLSVKSFDRTSVEKFSKEISPLITAGPPGVTGFSEGRPKVREIVAFWPTLIDKKLIKTEVFV